MKHTDEICSRQEPAGVEGTLCVYSKLVEKYNAIEDARELDVCGWRELCGELIDAAPPISLYGALIAVMQAISGYTIMVAGILPLSEFKHLEDETNALRDAAQLAHSAMIEARAK